MKLFRLLGISIVLCVLAQSYVLAISESSHFRLLRGQTLSGAQSASSTLFIEKIGLVGTTLQGIASSSHFHLSLTPPSISPDQLPPARPTLKPVANPTAQNPQRLSGTKTTGTAIWINGTEAVALNDQTLWNFPFPLIPGWNEIDLWAQDVQGRTSTHVSAKILYDPTPPQIPIVIDEGSYTLSLNQLHAQWSAQEDHTPIWHYAYAIGTTPGGTDVVPFTDAGTKIEITHASLPLRDETPYYFSVKATNSVGLTSSLGISDGIFVNTTPPEILRTQPLPNSQFYPSESFSLEIQATDPGRSPLDYRFWLDGVVIREWNRSPRLILDTEALLPGIKNLRMEVKDPFGGQDHRLVQLYLFRKPLKRTDVP